NPAMNRLRESLGDSAENTRFIETLPRRGYHFVAPIHVLQTAPAIAAPVVAVIPGAAPQVSLPEPTAVPAAEPEVAARLPIASWIVISRPSRIVLLLAFSALAVAVVFATLYLRIVRTPASGATKMTLAVLPFENLSTD